MARIHISSMRFEFTLLSCILFLWLANSSVQAAAAVQPTQQQRLVLPLLSPPQPPLTWTTEMIKPEGCEIPVGVAAIEPWMTLVESIQAIWACNSFSGGSASSATLVTFFVNGTTAATPVDGCPTIGTVTLDSLGVTPQLLVSCTNIDPSISPSAALVLSYDLPLNSSSVSEMLLSGNECQGAIGVASILVDWTSANQFFICTTQYAADSIWMISAGVSPAGQPTQFFQSDDKCPSISSIGLQYTSAPNSYGQILIGCDNVATETDHYALVAVNITGGGIVPFATPAQCSGAVQVYGSYDPGMMFFVACPMSPVPIVSMYSPDWSASTPMLTPAECASPDRILVDPFTNWVYISCAGNQTVLAFDSALASPYNINTVSQPYSCDGTNQLSISSTSVNPFMSLFVVCNSSSTLRVKMTGNTFDENFKAHFITDL